MIVDLRSDTVTKPPREMLEAMLSAELGDDVLGDDPTVHRLEAMAAERMGKEAAVYVPSGTMANQIAVQLWTQPGDAILVEQDAHVLFYESGGPGVHSGVVTFTLPSINGVMDPAQVESRITKANEHTPGTTLLCVENTHNRAGGTIVPLETMRAYREVADRHGLRIHLDGARIFNAAVALSVDAKEIAVFADSVSFCLSKGLSCPVGSLVCGPAAEMERAHRLRKRMGGAMRQTGLLAACGIYALENLVERLAHDHRRAREFAEHVNGLDGLCVDLDTVQTNIVRVRTDSPAHDWQRRLEEKGVRCFATGVNSLRFVFHREVDDEQTEYAKQVVTSLAG
ncbi:MAG: hypothetical protein C4341_09995 [Armatimonadota bacterium]